jgi:acyl-[acyl-carrier-protein]-phospholipid O-acyltransferase / long-chain-fatty-acid--[acyl-carrier-protein] ligase
MKSHRSIAIMSATYFMGIFDDNFFKEAAMILALAAGHVSLQGYASIAITVPRVLLAAPAGWMADRFSKRWTIIAAKVLELVAAACGAAGVLTLNWYLIFTMLALMGIQATMFSPAINGTLPEIYPAERIPRVNSILKIVTIAAILGGVAFAGAALDVPGTGPLGFPMGRMIVVAVIVLTAVGGLAFSFALPRRAARAPGTRFPWTGPWETFGTLRDIGKDALLAITVAVNSYYWFIGALQLMLINMMATSSAGGIVSKQVAHRGNTIAGLFISAILVGNGLGGVVAGRLSKGARWYKLLAPAAVAMGLFMCVTIFVPYMPQGARIPAMFAVLTLVGVAGGFLLVPTDSFMQVRAKATERGAILATSAFTSYSGIIVASPLANYLNVHLRPTVGLALGGALTVLVGLWTAFVLRPSQHRK